MLLTTAAYFSFLAAVFFAYWLAARYGNERQEEV